MSLVAWIATFGASQLACIVRLSGPGPILATNRPFFLLGPSYMRDSPLKPPMFRGAVCGVDGATGDGMVNRIMTAQSTTAMPRCGPPTIVTLAAMAALMVLTAPAAARQPAPPTVATAPREAGEPIMAIVSIKSQQVTFYDADGWILRAPVSTGTTGRETPAGVFAVIEKDKDHHSTLYDDAWMPNMQRITWNGIALHGGPLPGYAASHGCVRMPSTLQRSCLTRRGSGCG